VSSDPIKVRVRNQRAGALHVPAHVVHLQLVMRDEEGKPVPVRDEHDKPTGEFRMLDKFVPRPKLEFEPGDTLVDLDDLNMLPDPLKDEVEGWCRAGWIEMLPAELSPAPAADTAPDMAHATALIPADDAAAIELVKATSDAATLDAMFAAVGDRTAVSEAILAKLTELDRK
jgi:hypothetical protein